MEVEMEAELGLIPGHAPNDPYAARWDPRPDYRGPAYEPPEDGEWIGEAADGIWLTTHPEVALALDRDLRFVVSTWRMTTDRELTRADLERMSGFESVLWKAMLGAQHREEERRSRETSRG